MILLFIRNTETLTKSQVENQTAENANDSPKVIAKVSLAEKKLSHPDYSQVTGPSYQTSPSLPYTVSTGNNHIN